MQLVFILVLFTILALAEPVAGAGNAEARWEVDRDRLVDGTNLIYAIFGDTLATPPGIQSIISNLQLPDSAVVVSIDVGAQHSADSVAAIQSLQEHAQQARHSQVVLVLHDVEVLRSREQLLHLDFLFRLPDKAFGLSSLVVLLVWNTSNMQLHGQQPQRVEIDVSSEDFQVEPDADVLSRRTNGGFWLLPQAAAEREWREEVRSLWRAAGPDFNADAAIGRITRAVFLPAQMPVADSTTAGASTSPLRSSPLRQGLAAVCIPLNDWITRARQTPTSGAKAADPSLKARMQFWLRSVKARMHSVKILHAVKVVLLALLLLFFVLLLRQAFETMHSPQQQEYNEHAQRMKAEGAAWRRQQQEARHAASTGTASIQ